MNDPAGDAPIPVVVNIGGGAAARHGAQLGDRVQAAFAQANVPIRLHLVRGHELHRTLRGLGAVSRVMVGGGDGTLGCAGGVLADSGTALGILPLGTRNHLARELGVPLDLDRAAALVVHGRRRAIDLGSVNDHIFVNNASVGLYPALVRLRERERERHALPKWLAAIPASGAALRRLRHHRMRLTTPDRAAAITTPLLFVGNNHYAIERGAFGHRAALDDGRLSVYAVAARGRGALLGFALRTLAGTNRDDDFAVVGDVAALTVEGRSHHIDVALDGEVVRLAMPLRFASRPGALTVLVPDRAASTPA